MPHQPPVCDSKALYYHEPAWSDRETFSSPNVPGQISASLMRSKHLQIPWGLAWKTALRNVRWPHDCDDRHQWKALLDDQQFIDACWRTAFEGRPSGYRGDMSMLRRAIERDDSADALGNVRQLGEAA